MLFEMEDPIVVLFQFVVECSLEIVLDVLRHDMKFVDDLLFPLYHLPVCFCIVRPHLLHKEFDVLLRCRRLILRSHVEAV